MGPIYSGFVPVFQSITPATRGAFLASLETILQAAGWTIISGGGTATVLFESAATAHGLSLRLQALDPGSGSSIRLSARNAAGTHVQPNAYLMLTTLQVWANRHALNIFKLGGAPTDSRTTYFCGTPWLPLNLRATTTELIYAYGNGQSDTPGTVYYNWRTSLTNGNGVHLFSYNGGAFSSAGIGGGTYGCMNFSLPRHSDVGSINPIQFLDGAYILHAPLLCGSPISNTANAQAAGYLFDSIITTDVPVVDTPQTIDGKTWFPLTVSNLGSAAAGRGCVLLYIP